MAQAIKAHFDSVIVQVSGMMTDLHKASPTAAMNALKYMASMGTQFSMGTRVDDFIQKSHRELEREKKNEDLIQVIGFSMENGLPVQAVEALIPESYDYMMKGGLKEHIMADNLMDALIATGLKREDIELRIAGEKAKKRNYHAKAQMMMTDYKAELLAHASKSVYAAVRLPSINLESCEGWVIKQLIAKIDTALFGGKNSVGHYGYLFNGVYNQGITGNLGEMTDITNHKFEERIAKAYAEHELITNEWRFEVSRMMELDRNIGDDEEDDFAANDRYDD